MSAIKAETYKLTSMSDALFPFVPQTTVIPGTALLFILIECMHETTQLDQVNSLHMNRQLCKSWCERHKVGWTWSHSLPKCYNLPKKKIWPYIEHPTSQPLLYLMTTPPTKCWTAVLTPRQLSPHQGKSATFTIRGNTWEAEHCHCHNAQPCDQWDNSDEENIWTYSLINNKMYDIGKRSMYWFH